MSPRSVTNLPRDAREIGVRNLASQFSRSRYDQRRFGARVWALVVALAGGLLFAALMMLPVAFAILGGF